MKLIRDKKALSLIEVLVSSVILSIVLATYSSSTQGKQRILMQMKNLGVYQQLALSQLEKIMNFISSQERMKTTFASKAALDVDSDPLVRFRQFTRIFSQEGQSNALDEDKWSGSNTPLPRIDLMQLRVFGLNGADNYSEIANPTAQNNVFLSFPYPNELRAKSLFDVAPSVVSPNTGTFHNVTSLLKGLAFRDILPLVSEEYLTISDGDVGANIEDRYDQIGFNSSGVQLPKEVSLATGLNLFAKDQAINTDGADGIASWNNELIRRYVYYRKIREGNLVFSNAVRGKADTWTKLDANNATDTSTRGDKFAKMKTTDVDMLYIQHLTDWTNENGSANGGAIMGIKGTTFPEKIGGVGTHSIMVMVVVREADPAYGAEKNSIPDADFIKNSTIKSVAQGIVSPSYGKNLLWTLDLSYHRYQWSRIPGIRQRLLQSEFGDSMQ